MKISVIGGGNVGGLAAMRIAQDGCGEVVLVDIAKGLAQGKAYDMDDARSILQQAYEVKGSDEISAVAGSDIVVITAGLARKPGMTREDLLLKNAAILKDLCGVVKQTAPSAVLIIVTNPLDLMTRYALSVTGFPASRVFGMGISLDAARFANLIAQRLQVPVLDVEPCVIGSHGEGMMPLARFTKVKGRALDQYVDEHACRDLEAKTVGRGLEIVTLLGSGSAYFAPSAAVAQLVRCVAKDEKRVIGISAMLEGAYGVKGVCMGTPCRIGRKGVEQVVELELNDQERAAFQGSAKKLNEQFRTLTA